MDDAAGGTTLTRRLGAGLIAWVVVAGGVRLVVAPAERCPAPGPGTLRHAAAEAVGWLARNQHDAGDWVYRYDRASDRVEPGYNIVRHAGVTLSLAQAARAGIEAARAPRDAGTRWALGRLTPTAGGSALGTGPELETGASALLVAALVERRADTGSHEDDAVLAALGRFLVAQVEPDGRVLALRDVARDRPVPDETSAFYTGETLWALARLHATFPAAGWDEPARRVAHYVATARDDRERRFPPASDHWAAYAFDEMAHWPGGSGLTDAERAYALRQGGIFSVQIRFEAQKHGVGAAVRGPDVLGAGVGTWGEGLAALWRAGATDPDLRPERTALATRAGCVAGLLVDRQVGPDEAAGTADPARTRGAWFQGGITQMDDQQHGLSALLAALPIAEGTDR